MFVLAIFVQVYRRYLFSLLPSLMGHRSTHFTILLSTRDIHNHARFQPSYGEVEVETIFDEASDHYELCYTGWDGYHRIHGTVLHIDIRHGKIWIQHDGTEDGVAEEVVTAGVPRDHIVLGFQPPNLRKHTEYAAA